MAAELPPEALEAARGYYVEHWDDTAGGRMNPLYARDFITGLAAAMAPAIRAAERERIVRAVRPLAVIPLGHEVKMIRLAALMEALRDPDGGSPS